MTTCLKEKFTVIVPTMWRCKDVFARALVNYIECDLVDEVIIINNDKNVTPDWSVLNNYKIRLINQETNIFCNPAWNLGVELAINEKLCIVNDDFEFDPKVFEKVKDLIIPQNGALGMITGHVSTHPPTTDKSISIIQWIPETMMSYSGYHDKVMPHGFGQLFFTHKENWVPIPNGLDLYFGDDVVFHQHLCKGLNNYLIYNFDWHTPMAQTASDPAISAGRLEREFPIWLTWLNNNPLVER